MSFKIVVLAKQVPDTRNVGKDAMTAEGTVNRAALPAIFNPEDLNALEMALHIKDNIKDAEVIVLTMGPSRAADIIRNWLRNRTTLEFLATWEEIYNPSFKVFESEHFKKQAGLLTFTPSISEWVEQTNAIGLYVKKGRYGGTFAHKDIAFKFASWISVEFELYIVKEFQRLKEEEQKLLNWSAKRELSKINYHIHTDAIQKNLIPSEITPQQASIIYADEADVLNVAMFGITAKQWRQNNPDKKGNIRDYASINELICLSNMESLNAVFIKDGLAQSERLIKLNQIAIQQMKILEEVKNKQLLK
jgi:hypothetical protein